MGSHLTAQDFTDDTLGRCLDKIYEYGTTKFVSDITFQIASQLDLLGKFMYGDTSSLTLYGDYDNLEKDSNAPTVTYGFAKNKRFDLKKSYSNLSCQ